METQFNIGDMVWFVRAGHTPRYMICPDCCGTKVLTVIMGDGTQASIDCNCCREGLHIRGKVKVYDWHCEVDSRVVTRIKIDGDSVSYSVSYTVFEAWPDAVFATKEEAEAEAVKVLAQYKADEDKRINQLKDPKGRMKTWAWNVSYHQGCIKRAEKDLAYHQAKLAVAKAKAKGPKSEVA
jgi:hypothetical protein